MKLSFAEWQSTKQIITDHEDILKLYEETSYDEVGPNDEIMLYDEVYIIEHSTESGEYYLHIGNAQYTTYNLEELERLLYTFASEEA